MANNVFSIIVDKELNIPILSYFWREKENEDDTL